MESFIQNFTSRQHMITPNYEYFHYRDKALMDVEYHNHDFYEIYLFVSGNVTYLIEGRSYRLSPGDILLIRSGELHKPVVHETEPYERRVLWINPDYLHNTSDENSNLAICFGSPAAKSFHLLRPSSKMSAAIFEILDRFEYALASQNFGSNILREIYLLEYLVHVNKAYLESHDIKGSVDIQTNEKISEIIQYINRNLDKDLSLDTLSRKFYISKYHLTRQFSKYTGYTLHKFILQKRLIKSKTLLKEGARINEVCVKCGFNDYSNFIRSFKREYGIPPKKYASQSSR